MAKLKLGLITDIHAETGTPTPAAPFGDSPGVRIPGYDDVSVGAAVTRWNSEGVDIAVQCGDGVNTNADNTPGGGRDLNFDELVTDFSGISGYELFYTIGNWDTQGDTQTDYSLYFGSDGIQSLIPTTDPPTNGWWPSALNDDQDISYTVDFTADGQVWKLIFLGDNDTDVAGETGAGPTSKTHLQWLQDQLDDADTNGYPVLIFTHRPLYSEGFPTGMATNAGDARNDGSGGGLENQAIKPVVFQGHVHYSSRGYKKGGVSYFDLKGDVWGVDADDTGRFSHAVAELTYPGKRGGIDVELVGYGYQSSRNNRETGAGVQGGSYNGGSQSSYGKIRKSSYGV